MLVLTSGFQPVAVGKDKRHNFVRQLAESLYICCMRFVKLVEVAIDHCLNCLEDKCLFCFHLNLWFRDDSLLCQFLLLLFLLVCDLNLIFVYNFLEIISERKF